MVTECGRELSREKVHPTDIKWIEEWDRTKLSKKSRLVISDLVNDNGFSDGISVKISKRHRGKKWEEVNWVHGFSCLVPENN